MFIFSTIIFYRFTSVKQLKGFISYSNILILLIFSIISIMSLIISRPDNDDIEFFHRAFLQFFHLHDPIYVNETLLNFSGLPPLSILHLTTSYEYLIIFIAKIIGINPVIVYQNCMSWLASLITLLTYYSLFRMFGAKQKTSFIAVLLTVLFFIIDGNVHRSFGNMAFVRLWQGKTILWTTLIPICFFIIYKYITSKNNFYFFCIFMASVCALGLSNAGVFLIPIMVITVGCVNFFSNLLIYKRVLKGEIYHSILIIIGSLYCSVAALLITLGILPQPKDKTAWVYGWPSHWFENIMLVFGDYSTLVRDVLILLIVPFIALPFRKALLIIIYSLSITFLFFNPLVGPIVMSYVEPASYWRLVYLLPIPLSFGLIANIFEQWKQYKGSGVYLRPILALAIIIITLVTIEKVSISPKEISFKPPFAYKFDQKVLNSAKKINSILNNNLNLLIPDEMVAVLPLLNHNIRLEAGRSNSVQHYFLEYGDSIEGLRRQQAKGFIETTEPTYADAFHTSINSGVNGIISKKENLPKIVRELAKKHEGWEIAYIDTSYFLLLKNYQSNFIINFGLPLSISFSENRTVKASGNLDSVEENSFSIVLEGWINIPGKPNVTLIVTDAQDHILATTKNCFDRPDVSKARNDSSITTAGWITIIDKKKLKSNDNKFRIYYYDEVLQSAVNFINFDGNKTL